MADTDPVGLLKRFKRAREARARWETVWQDALDFTLPHRARLKTRGTPGRENDRLFDATAPDAVDQLAASLLSRLTPPWSRWFGLSVGDEIPPEEYRAAASQLESATATLQTHFDRSNFSVEMHQCFLDLVTVGSASLLFEEAPVGEDSAFRFTAVPLEQLYFEESARGRLDITFRLSAIDADTFRERFPKAALTREEARRAEDGDEVRIEVVEAVLPENGRYVFTAFRPEGEDGKPQTLATGRFETSPFINFRWIKAPGEAYGRSPVMKALPDIKTANKVVELVLKNASIAVTGIWQADDDGVLNPANIRLAPGVIIPKAVGSSGLTPLDSPGRFDVSQLVLDDLRGHIRHALLVDQLGQIDAPRMTATEVLERGAEMRRILGATYGRLQSELLTPLVDRALAILRRRKSIPAIRVDGRTIDLQYRSPLAQEQAGEDMRTVNGWLQLLPLLGPEAQALLDGKAAARWAARQLGVPSELLRDDPAEQTPAELAGAPDGPPGGANPLAALLGGSAPDPAAATAGASDPLSTLAAQLFGGANSGGAASVGAAPPDLSAVLGSALQGATPAAQPTPTPGATTPADLPRTTGFVTQSGESIS